MRCIMRLAPEARTSTEVEGAIYRMKPTQIRDPHNLASYEHATTAMCRHADHHVRAWHGPPMSDLSPGHGACCGSSDAVSRGVP